ncbi:MAG: spore coat U domain-containing protein, partial [Luteimonas sp.]|nr:spore coat U domain-containing protein [Luteimonas sp.]
QLDGSATVAVQCGAFFIGTIRTCISFPNSNESAGARLMTLPTGESVRFQLYKDAARTQPLGALGEANGPLTVDVPVLFFGNGTATIYGRVFPNQDDKPVGNYARQLTIQGRESAGTGTPCESIGGTPQSAPSSSATLTIKPMCTVAADPLDFGSFSDLSVNRDASTSLHLKCTLNAPYQISLNGGSTTGTVANRRMSQAGNPASIGYQLYSDSSRSLVWGNTAANWVLGTGTGASQPYTIYGRVQPQGMPSTAGTFEDTIMVTVSY